MNRVVELEYLYKIALADKATAPLLKASRQQEQAIAVQERALKKLGDTSGRVSAAEKRAAEQTARAAQLRAREAQRAADREISSLKATGKAYGQVERDVKRSTDSQRKHLKGLVGALGGLGVAYGAFNYAKKSISTTEELAKTTLTLSRSFGLSTKEASRWAAVAKARGAEGSKLVMGFKALATAIYGAESGSKAQVAAFDKLGISQVDLAKHGNDLQTMLRLVSDGMGKLPKGTDKAAIAAKLFGRTWVAIAPIVREGSKAMDEQLAMADKYGVTFNGHTIKTAHEFALAQREAKLASLGLQLTLGQTLIPALTKVTLAGNKFVLDVRRHWPEIRAAIDPVVTPLIAVAKWLGKITDQHPQLLTVVAGMAALGSTVRAIKFASAITGITTFLRIAGKGGGLVNQWTGLGDRAGRAFSRSAAEATTDQLPASVEARKPRLRAAGRLIGATIGAAAAAVILAKIGDALENATDPKHKQDKFNNWAQGGLPKWLQSILNARQGAADWIKSKIPGFQAGGMVPAFVSPGEQVFHGGGAWTVPGARTAADSVFTMLPHGSAVITGHGQQLMAGGASIGEALAMQAPHFREGGTVVRGKTSTFGPPGEAAGSTATGSSSRFPGVAIRPGATWQTGRPYLGGFWEIDLGKGHRGVLKQTDLGPNQWTGRRIDVTGAGARQLGINPANFPTDSVGTARWLGKNGKGARVTGTSDATVDVYRTLGKNPMRGGLLPDAFAQGLAGQSVLASVISAAKAEARQLTIRGHSQSTGGLSMPNLPRGGVNLGKHKPDLRAAMQLARNAGLKITSTTKGKHAANSWHYKGHAFDASNGTNTAQEKKYAQAIAAIFGTNLYEMFYDPLGWYVKNGRAVAGKIGGHSDHVHVAMGGRGLFQTGKSISTGGKPIRFRSGGVVGGAVSNAINAPASNIALGRLDRVLEQVAEQRLLQLRTKMLRAAQQGGDERVVKRLQAIVSLIDKQLGQRIYKLQQNIERRTGSADFATGLVDRRLRQRGVDPSSSQGLAIAGQAAQRFTLPSLRANLRDAQASVRKAVRAHASGDQVRELQNAVRDALAALDEGIVTQAERRRQQIVRFAQDKVDDAQFRVDLNTASRAALEAGQRVNGTAGTSAGLAEQASQLQQSMPALQAFKVAQEGAAQAALQTGDYAGYRQALLAAQGAATDLANAQADAAELIKQAAEKQASAQVDAADFQSSVADAGLQGLQLQQQLAGTADTATGRQQRASYIRDTIIPAMQAEVAAQQTAVQTELQQRGADSEEYRQAVLKLLGLQNELAQDQVDATQLVAENTEPLKEFQGSSAFELNGQQFLAGLLGVGSGA